MRKSIYLFTLLLSLGLPFKGIGQSRPMSLDEALTIASENNRMIKSASAGSQAAQGAYRMTHSVFLPLVSLNYTGMSTNDPLSVFGYKLKQETVTQADFDPARLNDPGSYEHVNTRIDWQQPLLNLDGIYARKAARNAYEAQELQEKRTAEQIRFEVSKAYYQLELASQSVKVMEQTVKAAEEANRLTLQNEAQGLLKKADVLEASVRLRERQDQLLQAKNQQKMAGEYLAHLLGLDLGTPIEPTDTLLHGLPLHTQFDPAAELEGRSDLQAWQKQLDAGKNMLQSEKMKFIPRVNAFAAYEWNDRDIAGFNARNYLLGANLRWDLFSGYRNRGSIQQAGAKLEAARLQYADYLSQSQIQLNQAQRQAELNYRQVRSSELAREQAVESFRIRTNRYREGLEKTADLLMAEALASQKKLEYLVSVYRYRESVFELEFLLEKELTATADPNTAPAATN